MKTVAGQFAETLAAAGLRTNLRHRDNAPRQVPAEKVIVPRRRQH
jgi:hypothetical protein